MQRLPPLPLVLVGIKKKEKLDGKAKQDKTETGQLFDILFYS
jgi:hypothetical protein